MADETLNVLIRASGGEQVSAQFKAVATGAQQMGVQTDAAAKKGSAGFKTMAADSASLSTRIAALGAAATVAAGFLSTAGRASEEAAQVQRQLAQAITNTGANFDDFRERVAQAGAAALQLGIDDEKAYQAIQALTEITGDAGVALDQMGLVMDVAAAKGMDLESAARLIGRVHEGNVTILQRYGIVVREGASAEEALAAIQASVAGQAEAHATTIDKITARYGEMVEGVGNAVGGFAPLVGLLPGLSIGFSAMGTAVGALAPKITASVKAATGLTSILGPIGLVAAAGVAAFAVYKLVEGHDSEAEAADRAEEATAKLVDTLQGMTAAGATNAALFTSWGTQLAAIFADLPAQIDEAKGNFENFKDLVGEPSETNVFSESTKQAYSALANEIFLATVAAENADEALLAFNAIIADTGSGAALAQAELKGVFDEFARTGDINALESALINISNHLADYDAKANAAAKQTADLLGTTVNAAGGFDTMRGALADLAIGFEDTARGGQFLADTQKIAADGTDALRMYVSGLISGFLDQVEAGTATAQMYVDLTNLIHGYAEGVTTTTTAVQDLTSAIEGSRRAAERQEQQTLASTAAQVDQVRAFEQSLARQSAAYDSVAAAAAAAAFAEQQAAEAAADHSDVVIHWAGVAAKGDGVTITWTNDLAAAAEAALAAANALGVMDTYAKQLRPIDIGMVGGDRVTGGAAALQGAGAAMDSVLGVFGTLDALNQRQQQAGSIVENLIGKPGEVGPLLGLLEQSRISQTRYNMTIAAGANIMARQAEVESDLNVIRAKQLPLLDQADARYAELIDDISHYSAEQATATLGFMDAAEAGKAQTIVALAQAAANTEVGSTSRAAAQAIIEGAVAADPVLETMLTQIGLVARDHEGNLVVNFDNADSLTNAVKGLTEAVSNLTEAINGIPPEANASVTVTGNGLDAAANIYALKDALAVIDGATATTTLNNVTNNISREIKEVIPAMHGGSFAHGGIVTARLAEAGPELVSFANGGSALVMRAGFYGLPGGSFVTPAPESRERTRGMGGITFTLNNYGPINGIGGLDDVFAEAERLLRARFTGLGMR